MSGLDSPSATAIIPTPLTVTIHPAIADIPVTTVAVISASVTGLIIGRMAGAAITGLTGGNRASTNAELQTRTMADETERVPRLRATTSVAEVHDRRGRHGAVGYNSGASSLSSSPLSTSRSVATSSASGTSAEASVTARGRLGDWWSPRLWKTKAATTTAATTLKLGTSQRRENHEATVPAPETGSMRTARTQLRAKNGEGSGKRE